MIYICGDTHRTADMHKLDIDNFPEQMSMSKSDYVIIVGDCGFTWARDRTNFKLRKYFNDKPFTTLYIDGNHENFDLLDEMKTYMWNGGKVNFISDSIIRLQRGQVFEIDGLKFFTFGGAKSVDKDYRTPGISWWPQEMPSSANYAEGLKNLENVGWYVDYVLTHDCSDRMLDRLLDRDIIYGKFVTRLNFYLEDIEEQLTFKHWYFGHFHDDMVLDAKHTLLFNQLIKITS